MKIGVTGGAGYIGSHFVKLLINSGYQVLVIDNLSRGHIEAVNKSADFEKIDLSNFEKLYSALKLFKPEAVVHFAAFAYVGESVQNPDIYYLNNVSGSLNLIQAVKEAGIKNFVFSSTCSLYGNPETLPINETQQVNPINPYAQTKLIVEKALSDYRKSYGINYIALRYFNAGGADPAGELGESHNPETHLIPIVLEAALGKREKVTIFGDDYDTPDGSCIRDYIHVNDLAEAHLAAIRYLFREKSSEIINLGSGNGYSVKEIINSAREITKLNIPTEMSVRRPGDPAVLVADNKRAKRLLDWSPAYNLNEIIQTAFNWHKNPKY